MKTHAAKNLTPLQQILFFKFPWHKKIQNDRPCKITTTKKELKNMNTVKQGSRKPWRFLENTVFSNHISSAFDSGPELNFKNYCLGVFPLNCVSVRRNTVTYAKTLLAPSVELKTCTKKSFCFLKQWKEKKQRKGFVFFEEWISVKCHIQAIVIIVVENDVVESYLILGT